MRPAGLDRLRRRVLDGLRRAGYTRLEQLRTTVDGVAVTSDGHWAVVLGPSARAYQIRRDVSPRAEALAARARELQASGKPCWATIAIHDDAPAAKTPEAFRRRRGADEPHPWVIVRLGDEPDPAVSSEKAYTVNEVPLGGAKRQ